MDISSLRERRDLDALSVSELNNVIKSLLDNASSLQRISVRGELSNVNLHSSGHIYFTLKDSESQIKCVMFRSCAQNLRFSPKEGMRVIVFGSISVYARGGSYQIYVNSMQPDGVGALYLAYTELKAKLEAEGLFDQDKKQSLPPYPKRIGVITSPTGAAVRDIIHVTGRRFPLSHIYLYPSLVQGDGAEDNLLSALDYFEKSKLVDVIIIGRGGGSIEDLWAFNSEKLARKIFSMTIPIVSAVGHETDFTICDFVSDMRAPTPSAAAEIVTPDWESILQYIDELVQRLSHGLVLRVERLSTRVSALTSHPVLKHGEGLLLPYIEHIKGATDALNDAFSSVISRQEGKFQVLLAKLDTLSPISVMRRGYSVAKSKDGMTVRSISQLSLSDDITVLLPDGETVATIKEIRGKS